MNAQPGLHPTDQSLHAYGLGKLDDASAESVNIHLEGCPVCRSRVAQLSSDSFLGRLQDAKVRPASLAPVSPSLAGLSMLDSGATSSAPPPASTLPPELADHPDYEIVRELGRGGMGVVYLAQNTLMGRMEVLKVVSGHLINKPGVLERFLREIRSAARLHHTNIVAAYSALRFGESLVLSMEYVEGYDLATYVKARGPMAVAHACYCVHQAALGLQHAHEHGMVHRDIKPANLIVARAGKKALVKVLDFGLAKVSSEGQVDRGLTREGQMLGTPDYIAPEQIRDAQSADIRADIYSLGCTFYYLLTGGPPFDGANLWDLYQAHFSMDAGPLNLVRPEVPVELGALVSKMMAKEPARRFQTPGEVAQALVPFFKLAASQPSRSSAAIPRIESQVALTQSSGVGRAPSQPAKPPPIPAPTGRRPSKTGADGVAWESLIEIKEDEPAIEAAKLKPAPAEGPVRRPPWKSRLFVAAAALFGLVVLGIVITIKTKNGETHKPSTSQPNGSPSVNLGRGSTQDGPAQSTEDSPPSKPKEKQQGIVQLEPPPEKAARRIALDDSFIPLFNGEDRSGWTFPLGNDADWGFQGGSIRGLATRSASTIATTRKDYEDFHLWMDIRSTDNLNKLLLVRASHSVDDVKYYVIWTGGLWVNDQIVSLGEYRIKKGGGPTDGSQATTDGLHEIKGPKSAGLAENTWHIVEIIAKGNTFRTIVDGREVSAFEDTESRLKRGQIAIRLPQGGNVEIREIKIKEFNRKSEKVPGTESKSTPEKVPGTVAPDERPGQVPGTSSHSLASTVTTHGFVALFNGRNSTGWEMPFGDGRNWFVDNRELVVHGGAALPTFIASGSDYKDFRLRFQLFTNDQSTKQVLFRARFENDNNTWYAFQIGGLDVDGTIRKTGAIGMRLGGPFGPGKNSSDLLREIMASEAPPISRGVGHDVEVRATGNIFSMIVDGQEVSSFEDTESRFKAGRIGFRVTQGGSLRIRNVELQELSPGRPTKKGSRKH